MRLMFIDEGKYPIFDARSSFFPRHFSWRIQTKNIVDIYVSIWCLYMMSIGLSKCGINIQHSILTFHKENTASR